MAKDLLILLHPGDAFHLAAPLLFAAAARDLELLHVCAAVPQDGGDLLSERFWEQVIAFLGTQALARFERVIVPSIQAPPPGAILCAAVATLGLPSLWTLSDSLHDEVFEVDRVRLPALMAALNEDLARPRSPGTGRPPAFATVAGLRKVNSDDIVNYAAYLGLPNCPRYEWLYAALDAGSDPWALGSSPYEQRRHAAEAELLDAVAWSNLVEVGACTGVFTRKIADAYPDRHVIAVESDALFLPRLRGMSGPAVSVFEGSIFDFHQRAEIFALASCIYEMDAFPVHVFELAEKAILTSHQAEFERNVVEKACAAHGWRKLASREVSPAAEIYCGELIIRDGSLANLWVRQG